MKFSKIIKISNDGNKDIYHLTVQNNRNFFGNNICLHNCDYSGNDDIFCFPAISTRETKIEEGERICQFSIRPSMDAPIWTKIKWLFINKIEFIEVDKLDDENRGGFGHSGGYKQ